MAKAKIPAKKAPAKSQAPAAPTAGELLDGDKAAPAPAAKAEPSSDAPSAQEILSQDRQKKIERVKSQLPASPHKKPDAKKAAAADDDDRETDEPELDDDEEALVGGEDRKPVATAKKGGAGDRTEAPKIDPALLERAQEVGLTPAQAKKAGSSDALKVMIEIAESKLDDEPPPAPRNRRDDSAGSGEDDDEEEVETPAPQAKGKKKSGAAESYQISFDTIAEEMDLNEATKEVLGVVATKVNEVMSKLTEELAEARGEAKNAVIAVRRRESNEIDQQMDEGFAKLPESLQEVYGTIPTENLPERSPLLKKRLELRKVMGSIQMARQNSGLSLLSVPKLQAKALRELHEDIIEKEFEREVEEKVKAKTKTKSNQSLLRANGRDPVHGSTGKDRAIAAIDEIFSRRK